MTESIHKSDLELKVLQTVESCLTGTPYRVVDLDCRIGGKSLVRIFIEQSATGLATIGNCAEVSRLLDPVLENSNLFPGAYELEVSSPGIERRLRLLPDFEKVIGNELNVEFTQKVESLGGSTRGTLVGVENGGISLKSQGKQFVVPLNQVKKAQTIYLESKTRG